MLSTATLTTMLPVVDVQCARDFYENKLGIKLGESTADGRLYLKCEEECLAACAGAPMMVVNGHYHEKLTPQAVDEILDGLK